MRWLAVTLVAFLALVVPAMADTFDVTPTPPPPGTTYHVTAPTEAAAQAQAEQLYLDDTTWQIDNTTPPPPTATTINTFEVTADDAIHFTWTTATPGEIATCTVVATRAGDSGLTRTPCAVNGQNERTTRSFAAGDYELRVSSPSDPTPDVKPFTIGGTPPPPPPPGGIPSVTNGPDYFYFPVNPQANFFFTSCNQEGSAQNEGFNQLDIDGSVFGGKAFGFVPDPGGSGRPVARYVLAPNTHSCQASIDNRVENYEGYKNARPGTYWIAEGFYVPGTDPFGASTANATGNLDQLHSVNGGGPPPFTLDYDSQRVEVSIKQRSGAPREDTVVGPAPVNHWVYAVVKLVLSGSSNGAFQAWSAVDHLPNLGAAPDAQRSGIVTQYSGPGGYWKGGLYDTSLKVLYKCGQAIQPTADQAQRLGTCPL